MEKVITHNRNDYIIKLNGCILSLHKSNGEKLSYALNDRKAAEKIFDNLIEHFYEL